MRDLIIFIYSFQVFVTMITVFKTMPIKNLSNEIKAFIMSIFAPIFLPLYYLIIATVRKEEKELIQQIDELIEVIIKEEQS